MAKKVVKLSLSAAHFDKLHNAVDYPRVSANVVQVPMDAMRELLEDYEKLQLAVIDLGATYEAPP